MPQKMIVGERSGGNLVDRNFEPLEEIDRIFIPWRSKPCHFYRFAEGIDLLVLLLLKLQPIFQLTIGGSEWVFARLRQLLSTIDNIHSALLKLDRIAASSYGDADQSFSQIDITVVVDADFGNDEARLVFTNQLAADRNGIHGLLLLLIPSEAARRVRGSGAVPSRSQRSGSLFAEVSSGIRLMVTYHSISPGALTTRWPSSLVRS